MELTKAAADVLAERRRQVESEGWTPGHDDAHGGGDLAMAAACYAMCSPTHAPFTAAEVDKARIRIWPWSSQWWKPTTPRRDLVKAAALLLAEIERLDRMTPTPPHFGPDNPPRLRKPGESVDEYRAAMGWSNKPPNLNSTTGDVA